MGSIFHEIDLISNNNLRKIVVNWAKGLEYKEYEKNREELCTLFGGHVLIVNNEKLFYPQCYDGLGDIVNTFELRLLLILFH
jgi:hypothetical protein